MPYNGKVLEGEALRKQLDKWADYGTIEPTARDAIAYLIDNPKQLDLSDKVSARELFKPSRIRVAHQSTHTTNHNLHPHNSTSCCWARAPPWARS